MKNKLTIGEIAREVGVSNFNSARENKRNNKKEVRI
jgi:hypothetical protein